MGEEELPLETVEEFLYNGTIGGFLKDTYTIELRLYPDGTADGDVLTYNPPVIAPRKLSTATHRRKRKNDEMDLSILEVCEDKTRCASIKGQWKHSTNSRSCQLEFYRDQHVLMCSVELVKNSKAIGTWSNKYTSSTMLNTDDNVFVIENTLEWEYGPPKAPFQPLQSLTTRSKSAARTIKQEPITTATSEVLINPVDPLSLYPLSPGKYHFRGFTTTTFKEPDTRRRRRGIAPTPCRRDECSVVMELYGDGMLKGYSREVVYPQRCKIQGKWDQERIQYTLEYNVRGEIGLFKYTGHVEVVKNECDGVEGKVEDNLRMIKGQWRNIDANENTPGYNGGRGFFELECVQIYRHLKKEMSDDDVDLEEEPTINVFTTGLYTLSGKAIDDDGYEYASQLEIELLCHGKLRGVSREKVFEQSQRVRGNWTPTSLQFYVDFVVKHEIGTYRYNGTLDDEGAMVVQGTWCNNEMLVETLTRGEKGTFAFAVVHSIRQWSQDSHQYYSKSFQQAIQCLLLCSQQQHRLPTAMWCRIFQFCHNGWFQKIKLPVETGHL